MDDPTKVPFNWWWSGKFWYCHLENQNGRRVSGSGVTKPQAVADARLQLKRKSHSAGEKQ